MANEGMRGDLRLDLYESGWGGRPSFIARLLKPGSSTEELLPQMVGARVLRVREAMLIAGMEQIPRGRKSVERYRQTWVCSPNIIAPDRWPGVPARPGHYTGFDPAEDDIAY